MDLVITLGVIFLVIGLGIKMRGETNLSTESEKVNVEKKSERIPILVDINTASATELNILPAIGPVMAQRIIDYRNTHGVFRDKLEIKRVSGIGEKTYEKIKDKIKI